MDPYSLLVNPYESFKTARGYWLGSQKSDIDQGPDYWMQLLFTRFLFYSQNISIKSQSRHGMLSSHEN